VVPIRYRRRLGALCALATVGALATLTAPASALTVTIPTLPAPLPAQPVGGSVSTGTGGDPVGVTVTLPRGSEGEVEAPGLPTLPVDPTGPLTGSLPTTPTSPVIAPAPAAGTSQAPQPSGNDDPSVAIPGGERAAAEPTAPISGAQPAAGAAAPGGSRSGLSVNASINAQPASDSLLHRLPALASRVALWAALAAIVFVLQLLVGSAVREHRRKTARVG
jgi:hypothetical protein